MTEPAHLEVDISGLGASGEGVGRLNDGRVIFVPQALPGDRVRIQLTATRKQVQFAEMVDLITPSPDRVESRCTIEACGGCALKKLAVRRQGELKRSQALENLRRIGGIDATTLLGEPAQLGDGWRYRHRVRLHAAWLNGGWQLGYFARRSHRLVPLSDCPVLWPELQDAALRLAKSLSRLPDSARLAEVELAYSRRDGRAAAALHGDGPMSVFRESGWYEDSGLSGVEIVSSKYYFRHGNIELRYDHGRADEYDIRFDPAVFTQAFPQMNDRLIDRVVHALGPQQEQKLLELHAGVGNFTIALARAGARITAVEQNKRAAVLCRRNARAAGLDIDVRDVPDTEALSEVAACDVVLLDPPRTGAKEACEALAAAAPRRVVYVSCDSATLARDAATLIKGGYRLSVVEAFDMFPQTPHLELLTVFDPA